MPIAMLDLIRKCGGRIIAVEGAPHSGKTTFAGSLGPELSADIFHVDAFVRALGELPYPELVDCVGLGRKIATSAEEGRTVIVEGICLREVLGRAGVVPDFVVYVRNRGNEIDHVSVDLQSSELESFEREYHRESLELGVITDLTLALENARYHSRYRPVAQADYIYEWSDT